MIFDGHSDLLYDVTRRRLAGETRVLERCHRQRLDQGNIEGLVLAVWANPAQGESYRVHTQQILSCASAEFAECPWLKIVRTAAEAEQAKDEGYTYAFLGIEGMAAVRDTSDIDCYADFGARLGMLTWNEENALATGAGGDAEKGLTMLGRNVVRKMEERNILVDVSHLNVRGFWDVMGMVRTPVIASHSNCRALCDVPRNLTDEQLRAIRDSGGVVGLNVYHSFVHVEPMKQTVEMLARHAVHMAEVMGVEYVACGFDFCEFFGPGNEGVQGMENCAQVQNFFDWLERFGMSAKERQMIARENFLRLFR